MPVRVGIRELFIFGFDIQYFGFAPLGIKFFLAHVLCMLNNFINVKSAWRNSII